MKYIILVLDGMADYRLEELGKRTPLEIARTPNMDFIAQNGIVGTAAMIPANMSSGSDVATLSILGYDPEKYYTGRGPLEAANMGIELDKDDVVFRCNLVTVENEHMVDYSAGHIPTNEAHGLISFLEKELGSDSVRFYPGVSYRHLVVIKGTDGFDDLNRITCTPPHDITGQDITNFLPRGKGCESLLRLMRSSKPLLEKHEINNVRIDLKENPANMIWLWGQGAKPDIPGFYERYGLNGAAISAVDLVKGIARIMGWKVIDVPGATGYYDTDYIAKAKYGLNALKENDLVFIHVEAADEASHNGDLRAKINAIENFDKLVAGTVLNGLKRH
ncbi:MAG: cofactor-independent phosphoglycerate mutase, partial [Candidatus Omnitrophica bacterium]|nr:cofactor-independent phosphoglycerate mutase [Candidatus Omnitrophota bacterium]